MSTDNDDNDTALNYDDDIMIITIHTNEPQILTRRHCSNVNV